MKRVSRHPGHVRERDQLCPARYLLGDEAWGLRRRRVADARNPHGRRRGEQRSDEPEVLDVGGDDLVLGGEAETGENDVARVCGRADERDVLGSDLEHAGQRLAGALAEGEYLLEIRFPAAAQLEVPAVELRHRLDRRAGKRTIRAGVQVRVALEDGKLGSGFVDRQATLASTGV